MSLTKCFIRTIVLLACVMVFAAAGYGQFRAGIEGTVTDRTGAAVKGAKITVTSQETGASQDVTTGDTGFYSVSHLAPGLYTVTASFAGFKTNVIKDVQVNAESTAGADLVLQPGALTEQVLVNGDTLSALDTEDASLSGTITTAQVEDLPQFRGDPFELLRLTPGVFGLGARASNGDSTNLPGYSGVGGSNRSIFQVENAVQVSANGSRVEANGYQLDGVSTNSQGWGGASVITPNEESVKEIKVEVSPYSAENSHGAGAIVEVVSQNGTNNFHGSAVLRIHSPGLNAYNRWGGPFGGSPNRDNQILHNVLGSLGGPIWKNKLFAFFSFEHMKTGGAQYRASSWVETSQWISKLPSGSLAAKIFSVPGSGFTNPKILTSTCALLGLAEDPNGPGHVGTCQTVTGGVDLGSNTGTAGTLVQNNTTYPSGNTYSIGGGLDGSPDVALVEYDGMNDNIKATQFNGRVDYNVTSKDLVAFSLFYVPQNKTFLPGGWVDGRQYNTFHTDAVNETAALLWNRTIGPSMINEARMNVTRWYFDEIKSNSLAPFGLPKNNISIPQNGISTGFPFGPGVFYQTTYTFRDTLSKVHGSHVLKFGGEYDKEQNNSANTGGAVPSFDFNNLWSFGNDAPIDEGTTTFNPKTGVPTDFRKYIRVSAYGFFGQDTWKVRSNLTLTLGLRYDYFTPIHEKYGRLSNIVLGQGAATLTGATIQTGGNFTNPSRHNFGPQIGFAWSPKRLMGHEFNSKFLLRGGVGLAYNRVQENLLLSAVGNPPDFISTNFATNEVVYGMSSGGVHSFSGFPANPAAILTFDPNTGLPQPTSSHYAAPDINGAVRNLATPYTWHYSLEGQYDLGHSWLAAISYQGSQSRKFARSINDALFYAIPTGLNTITNTTVPLMNSVNIVQTDVNAHYNALLTRISHRLSKGLEMSASYRYSKSMDQCSSDATCNMTDPFSLSSETGPSDFDVTHSFTANALYELPFFKGRHDLLYTVAGGWKLGAILTLNSGFPWTPTFQYGSNACTMLKSQRHYAANDSNCIFRAAAYLGGAKSNYSTSTFQQQGGNFPGSSLTYFSPAVDPRTFTIPPVPAVGRNSFRGPRYTGIDMSFGKRFTLPKMRIFGENAGFEIKANAFNVFNKLNLAPFSFNSDSTRVGTGDFTTSGSMLYSATANSNFGRATGALGGRVIEFMGRFSF
jgi:hypothetical protein